MGEGKVLIASKASVLHFSGEIQLGSAANFVENQQIIMTVSAAGVNTVRDVFRL